MTIHLGRSSLSASCNQPGRQAWKPARRQLSPATMPPLFGLAPGGVCRAAPVTSRAVRSYRTLSPLPWRTRAVCFLWHCPWGCPRRTLSGAVFPKEPGLSSADAKPRSGHPADWLDENKAMRAAAVKCANASLKTPSTGTRPDPAYSRRVDLASISPSVSKLPSGFRRITTISPERG